ncbi:hypothetical protein E2562_002634 [Oryza meyeriana var. granulata]|uniref:Uncharacterized protein n=1 Tax=Oryza meyeriana var. granulata TaxID=110450 RepID=A0A6G1F305_9ORYZ|nr:hypothetical protein E2562_002634 [Oryza meyeriana var. granulata]
MAAAAALTLAVAAALIAAACLCAEAVWLDLPQSGTKCVSEEIQSNVVVLADYSLMYESHPSSHPTIAVKVTSPYGNTLHHNENATVDALTMGKAGDAEQAVPSPAPAAGSGSAVRQCAAAIGRAVNAKCVLVLLLSIGVFLLAFFMLLPLPASHIIPDDDPGILPGKKNSLCSSFQH